MDYKKKLTLTSSCSVARILASWSKCNQTYAYEFPQNSLIKSTVRLFKRLHITSGVYKLKKRRTVKKRYKRLSAHTDRTAVPANFPNFANKLSDVKIPRWIVKVLTSSAILQSPSFLELSPLFLYACTIPCDYRREKGRETKTKTRLTGDCGARWRKSTLVLYLPRVVATASGREKRRGKSSRK